MRPARLAAALLVLRLAGPAAAQSPVPPVPAPAADPAALERQLDRALTAIPANPSIAAIARAALAGPSLRYDPARNAIVTLAHPEELFEYLLVNDRRYGRSFAKLAALHLDAVDQPGMAGVSARPVDPASLDVAAKSPRIIDNAAQMRRSFMMRILRANGSLACTGVLVSPTAVLTAVHCLCAEDGQLTRVEFLAADGRSLQRRIAGLASAIDDATTRAGICRFGSGGASPYALENGSVPTPSEQKGRDVLLLELDRAVASAEADPVRLASNAAQSNVAAAALIAGFGSTSPNGPTLKSGQPPLATVVAIGDALGTFPDGGKMRRVCPDCNSDELPAGRIGLFDGVVPIGGDACHGDSGGPFFLIDGPGVERALAAKSLTMDTLTSKLGLVLAGLTSRTLGGCRDGAIYERLDTEAMTQFFARHGVSLAVDGAFIPF